MHAKVRFFLTVVFWFALDVILAAVIVVSAYIFSYKVPHKLPSMNIPTTDVSAVDFGEAFREKEWQRTVRRRIERTA